MSTKSRRRYKLNEQEKRPGCRSVVSKKSMDKLWVKNLTRYAASSLQTTRALSLTPRLEASSEGLKKKDNICFTFCNITRSCMQNGLAEWDMRFHKAKRNTWIWCSQVSRCLFYSEYIKNYYNHQPKYHIKDLQHSFKKDIYINNNKHTQLRCLTSSVNRKIHKNHNKLPLTPTKEWLRSNKETHQAGECGETDPHTLLKSYTG